MAAYYYTPVFPGFFNVEERAGLLFMVNIAADRSIIIKAWGQPPTPNDPPVDVEDPVDEPIGDADVAAASEDEAAVSEDEAGQANEDLPGDLPA